MAKRKYGDGSVFQRKDGRWEGRVVIGYDSEGLPKTKNVLAKSKTECEEKLAAMIIEVKAEKERLLAEKAAQELAEKEAAEAKPKKRQSKKK